MTKAIQWSDLELVQTLGEGRAGKVWLAKLKSQFKDFSIGALVAVKCYKSWVLEEPGQFERIIRELELGRRIQHPNLVKTLSIIRDPSGKPALVMAYYAGETLEGYLEGIRRKRIPIGLINPAEIEASGGTLGSYLEELWRKEEHIPLDVAFNIVGDLASAISAVHQSGAIHRDIKPANIILSDSGPILMDFGVISSKDFPEQTTSGEFLGTIRYAAPEYLFGESYDSRIDVYSLGAIAFELFGEKQFYSEETQWARLVVKKSSPYEHLSYSAIQRHYGLNTAEFIKFVVERTLAIVGKRITDVSTIAEAISNRLWERPFHIKDMRLIEGEPIVAYLGKQNDESKGPLNQVVEDLRERISKQDRAFLSRLLTEKYHTFRDGYYWSSMFSVRLSNFIEAGCLIADSKEPAQSYKLHEAVIAAYRYGYLE